MYSFTTFLQGPDLEYFKMHALNYTADLVANGFEQAEFRDRAGCSSMRMTDSYET